MTSRDKNWAKEYILDPLTAPEPVDETGPGTHFVRPKEDAQISGTITPPGPGTNGFGQRHGSPSMVIPYPSPPHSSSPRKDSHRNEAFGQGARHRRSSSLQEKFPGDMSHRPLDQLAKEKAQADRARHATKKHHIRPDEVDRLDEAAAGGAYHHGGPYDATLYARNNSYRSSPVAAVSSTNQETLKATPRERIIDSLQKHRPLDGTATYPPGEADVNGNVYNYEQGENMMVDLDPPGGAYKRWPGLQYHPDDIKGKSEPSYTKDKLLKEHNQSGHTDNPTEMTSKERTSTGTDLKAKAFGEENEGVHRSGSLSKRIGDGIKRKFGSTKRNSRHDE